MIVLIKIFHMSLIYNLTNINENAYILILTISPALSKKNIGFRTRLIERKFRHVQLSIFLLIVVTSCIL